MEREILAVVEALKKARRLFFITGAGLSADSNLPTYRGIGGLYQESDTEDGVPIEEALSGSMFRRRPELTWRHIARIEAACRGARFNRGHEVIAELERRFPGSQVLTQNVDGFHSDAGSKNLIDIHGDLHQLLCPAGRCGYRTRVADYSGLAIPPRCPDCGAILRPEIVLFGEMLPLAKVQRLQSALQTGFDMVFSIGTSSGFPYISEPIERARAQGIPTVEINPGETEVSHLVSIKIRGRAAESLDKILHQLVEA